MGNLSFKVKKELPKYETGGQLQKMQPGGVVQGPAHEAGGVPVVDEGGEPIAEVEGGERIFSVEDTAALEQMATQVVQAAQQDPAAADQMATQLGYAVVQMLVGQEMANPSAPEAAPQGGMPPEAMGGVGAGEIVPPGGGEPYMEMPM